MKSPISELETHPILKADHLVTLWQALFNQEVLQGEEKRLYDLLNESFIWQLETPKDEEPKQGATTTSGDPRWLSETAAKPNPEPDPQPAEANAAILVAIKTMMEDQRDDLEGIKDRLAQVEAVQSATVRRA